MIRVDLFTTIHKGVRVLLFDVATAAARLEVASDQEVDILEERIDHALDLVEGHESAEHAAIFPVLELIDGALAKQLAQSHHELDAASNAVRRAARSLALAGAGERTVPSRELLQAVNDFTVRCLGHLHQEETLVNATLWGALGDRDLLELQQRIVTLIGEDRCSEWRTILEPAVSEAERALLFG